MSKDINKAKSDLSKSEVTRRLDVLTKELQLASASTDKADFDKHIHLARLATHKIAGELRWYFGEGQDHMGL